MRKVSKMILGLACLVGFTKSVCAETAPVVGDPAWKARMQAMLEDVVTLFPYAFDDQKFSDPKNADAIERSLRSLSSHAKDLKSHTDHFDAAKGLKIDPSFPFVAEAFEIEVTRALSDFVIGSKDNPESQKNLRAAISKCTMCHSQSSIGPQMKLDQFKSQISKLSPDDRITAYSATRQFDDALAEFKTYAKVSKTKKPAPNAFDKNARAAITIAVRVKRDAEKALDVTNSAIGSNAGTSMLMADLKSWRQSVLEWQKEKVPAQASDDSLFANAKNMIEAAKKHQEPSGAYENQSIPYLRASSFLHELLSNYPKSRHRADSYILLASTYEALPGFSLWDTGDQYLGACIKENAHTAMAEKCSALYEDSITAGYTGSSGTHIPQQVKLHLQEMKSLAAQNKKP